MAPTAAAATKRVPSAAQKASGASKPKADDGAGAAPVASAEARDELIRQTAYFCYELSGRAAGHDLDNWLKAESLVDQQLAAASPGH